MLFVTCAMLYVPHNMPFEIFDQLMAIRNPVQRTMVVVLKPCIPYEFYKRTLVHNKVRPGDYKRGRSVPDSPPIGLYI
jgi:hypothetical protein